MSPLPLSAFQVSAFQRFASACRIPNFSFSASPFGSALGLLLESVKREN
jgi:hypothetical protein